MNWKETLQSVADRIESIERTQKYLQAMLTVLTRKVDHLHKTVEVAAKDRGQSIDRMADRLIEMAMVHKGMSRDAAIHRRSLGEPDQPQDLWQDSPDTEWPPPGCDAVSMP